METKYPVSPEIPLRQPRKIIFTNKISPSPQKSYLDSAEEKRDRPYDGHFHCRFSLSNHSRGISNLKFHPSGACLCSAGADGFIFLWDYRKGIQTRQLLGHLLGVDEIAFSHCGSYLCSASDDRTVKIWDLEKGVCIRTMKEHVTAAFSCGWNVQAGSRWTATVDWLIDCWQTW